MKLVIVESPYGATAGRAQARNVAYARAALADCLARGEAPFASHLLYTQPGVLDDDVPAQRRLGINAGLAWGKAAAATVVYVDLGITAGMRTGIDRARLEGRPLLQRSLPGWRRSPSQMAASARRRRPVSGNIEVANRARHESATPAVVRAAEEVLGAWTHRLPSHHVEILKARVKYPHATLTELADILGMTKDQASGRLRRALDVRRRETAA